MVRQVRRFIKYLSAGIVAGGSALVLQRNDWDISSIGAVRFGRAAVTAVKIVVDYKKSLHGLDEETEHYREMKSQVHLRSALRLRELCCINRGCFIKVGQHIGALEYLLPIEYVNVMKVLHSDAPQSPVSDIRRVIKEDLGKDTDELFESFSEKPVGTASLAQVHKATLKTGQVVAVKVQHPKVKSHAIVDMATMDLLVYVVSLMFSEFKFKWLAEETRKNLPIELDFVNEAKNCERVDKMLSHFEYLKVPKIYWNFTTERVLTMEFCEGGQVNDKDYIERNNIDADEVSCKLGQLYSEMIFVQGYIHCDPHPGNVLVHNTPRGTEIILLDHGLYLSMTDRFRMNYCKLWRSILRTDLKGLKKYAQKMGTGELYPLYACMVTARSWDSLSKGIDKQQVTKEEEQQIRENAANYLPEITNILSKVPRQMLLIFKTNDLLRGIEASLGTHANARSFIVMSKSCVRAVYRHKQKRCRTFLGKVSLSCQEKWTLFKISMYQFLLYVRSFITKEKQHLKALQ